jgi:hypothetical protein
MCRVLACENYKLLILKSLKETRNLVQEGNGINCLAMDSTWNEASSSIIATKIDENASILLHQPINFLGLESFNAGIEGHSARNFWLLILLARRGRSRTR